MEVVFRLPSLGEMAALGELPTELHELAIAEWSQPGISAHLTAVPFAELRDLAKERGSKPTEEELEQVFERSRLVAANISKLSKHVAAAALIEPTATAADLERMPYRDLEMLTILVNRGSGVDATGRHVGVVPLDTFQLVAQTHGAECDGAPACEACLEASRELALLQ